MRQEWFGISGHELHYEHLGGDDAPIVCLPGFSCSSRDFRGIVERLDRTNIYALDVWGQGRSPWVGNYGTGRDADTVAEFLTSISGPAVLVGYSRGGLLSFDLAARYPELVAGVYAIDVTPFLADNPNAAQIGFLQAVFALERPVREFRADTRPISWLTAQATDVAAGAHMTLGEMAGPDVVARWAVDLADCDPDIWTALKAGPDPAPPPAAQALGAARCPIHIAHGDPEAGSFVAAGEADRVIDAAARGSATHFPGCSHPIHQQQPDQLVDDLRAFLHTHDL